MIINCTPNMNQSRECGRFTGHTDRNRLYIRKPLGHRNPQRPSPIHTPLRSQRHLHRFSGVIRNLVYVRNRYGIRSCRCRVWEPMGVMTRRGRYTRWRCANRGRREGDVCRCRRCRNEELSLRRRMSRRRVNFDHRLLRLPRDSRSAPTMARSLCLLLRRGRCRSGMRVNGYVVRLYVNLNVVPALFGDLRGRYQFPRRTCFLYFRWRCGVRRRGRLLNGDSHGCVKASANQDPTAQLSDWKGWEKGDSVKFRSRQSTKDHACPRPTR